MSPEKSTILAVDDTAATLTLLSLTLSAAGYAVLPADSGEQALASLKEHKPDLILLDLCMEGMSGLDVCRRLKSDEPTRNIPVILMSAFADAQQWVEGLSLGAVDYVNKPFQAVEILSRVKTHIALAKTHEALRASEEKFRSLFQNADVAMLRTSFTDGTIIDVNNKICAMYGGTREELLGKPAAILWADPEEREQAIMRVKEHGQISGFEHKMVNKQGRDRDCLTSIKLYREEGILEGAIVDITDFKRAEERVGAQQKRTADILAGVADTFYSLDKDWRFTVVNPAAEKAPFGRPAAEMVGKVIWDLYPKLVGTFIHRHYLAAAEKHTLEHYEGQSPLNRRWYEVFMQGWEGGVDVYMRDITDRKQAEAGLRDANEHLNTIFASSPLALIVIDPDGNVMKWNPAAEKIFGWSEQEVLGKFLPFVAADTIDEHTRLRKRLLNGEALSGVETVRWKKNGSAIDISISAAPMHGADGGITGIMSVIMDITDRKKSEAMLLNVQKLESLGVLAGGIAHDFNNLLGGIFGYVDLAADATVEKSTGNYLGKALSTIHRARGLTHQLLTFAKGGEPVKKIGSFTPFLEDTARFALSGSNCSSEFRIAENLWKAEFDRNQIGQVIDNIVINAQQAMPGGGAIDISASNVTFAEKAHATLAAGDYVKISFCDRGIGMPEEILPRIFDPFFTTKPKGHGLGLATCYSIVKRHGGCIEVESKPGRGSTFHVYLPALAGTASAESGAVLCRHSGCGTFLVMDDEEVIRETVGDMLKSFGYTVVQAQNGREAVDFFISEHTARRRLAGMIFDLTVPGGAGGREAIEAIRKIDGEVPVFVASGYADDPVMSDPGAHGFTASICKPFRKSELAEILNKHQHQPKTR